MKKISAYVKCQRCDLNYIPRGETMCDVCKAELNLIQTGAILSDDEEIICPICKQNYMSLDDDMCLKCLERNIEVEHKDKAIEWDIFDGEKLDDDLPVEDLEIVSLSELEDEEKEKFFDEEDEEVKQSLDDELDDEDFDLIDDIDLDDDEDEDEDEDF